MNTITILVIVLCINVIIDFFIVYGYRAQIREVEKAKIEALRIAVNYMYLADDSDFYNSLWEITKELSTDKQYKLATSDIQKLLIQLDKQTGNYDPDIWEED